MSKMPHDCTQCASQPAAAGLGGWCQQCEDAFASQCEPSREDMEAPPLSPAELRERYPWVYPEIVYREEWIDAGDVSILVCIVPRGNGYDGTILSQSHVAVTVYRKGEEWTGDPIADRDVPLHTPHALPF